ncbi:MAG: xanthine dehydrogenase accessory protein XdhC [Pararhodobacter sp.]|nr:xanthine dehydrogenase accessory protein XdhC [Pararhodobacter sp.]
MLDRAALARAVARHGMVVRVVIAAHHGSSPREAGAAMLIWSDGQGWGQEGTIGGGALEWQAAARAHGLLEGYADQQPRAESARKPRSRPPTPRDMRAPPSQAGHEPAQLPGRSLVQRLPLGPALGQCCGGAVTLAYEVVDAATLACIPETGLHARRLEGDADMPFAIARALRDARGQGSTAGLWKAGWLAEPVAPPARLLWVWGAGHVGRAIVATLAPLPDFALTWIDAAPGRFPEGVPAGVTTLHAPDPADLVPLAPRNAEHLILTYSHALDLALCHRVLGHGFAHLGLIGSASKSARFRSRLRALGHTDARIARICCPIGDPSLGKHPQAIALGVGAALLKNPPDLRRATQTLTESAG